LTRHKREVHSDPTFKCPVLSCTRHRKGFGRRDNLNLHMKRVHQVQEPISSPPLSITCPSGSNPQTIHSGEDLPRSKSGSRSLLDVPASNNSILPNNAAIVEKIQELEEMKVNAVAKFDGDIGALRRVLSIM
jgi:hypothetical protein